MPLHFPGLDYDFLRYMGVRPEVMRQIQGFYLPQFASCRRVFDLGCGDGDFLALLIERGIEGIGVDSDEKAFAAAQALGLPVIQQDVFTFLHQQESACVDGIFCAHLVEHLPYPKVIELVQESFRVLRPGGRIILATPNVRSLFSHLEMFYMHFGHVSFYHPKLLCFFLQHAGFQQCEEGENPNTGSPLLPEVRAFLERYDAQAMTFIPAPMPPSSPEQRLPSSPPIHYLREIPRQGKSLLRLASYYLKRALTHWLVQPLTDDLVQQINQNFDERQQQILNTQAEMRRELLQQQSWHYQQLTALLQQTQQVQMEQFGAFARALQSLNGAFECYATAIKPVDPS
jgi:SAM-dependent methyltransferase